VSAICTFEPGQWRPVFTVGFFYSKWWVRAFYGLHYGQHFDSLIK
jgi:hypothetical protein